MQEHDAIACEITMLQHAFIASELFIHIAYLGQ